MAWVDNSDWPKYLKIDDSGKSSMPDDAPDWAKEKYRRFLESQSNNNLKIE